MSYWCLSKRGYVLTDDLESYMTLEFQANDTEYMEPQRSSVREFIEEDGTLDGKIGARVRKRLLDQLSRKSDEELQEIYDIDAVIPHTILGAIASVIEESGEDCLSEEEIMRKIQATHQEMTRLGFKPLVW